MARRNPKKEPAILSGTEIRNHIRSVANIVPRGTAPEECAAIRKKLRKTKVPKTILRRQVSTCHIFGLEEGDCEELPRNK
jgi:hypothetical protein